MRPELKQILDTCEPSYAKTVGYYYMGEDNIKLKAEFNWYKALTRKNITDAQWYKMQIRSNDWVTCACGNQCEIIPRIISADTGLQTRPKDTKLTNLGLDFNDAIGSRDKVQALAILDQIEERSAELIAEIKGIKI